MNYVPVEPVGVFIDMLVDRGFGIKEIGRVCGLPYETISRWKNRKMINAEFDKVEILVTSFGYHISEVWKDYWEASLNVAC